MRGIRIIATTIVLAAVAHRRCRVAAQNRAASREAFFRCKDRNGPDPLRRQHAAGCAGMDTEVLNDHGMLVRLIEGEADARCSGWSAKPSKRRRARNASSARSAIAC